MNPTLIQNKTGEIRSSNYGLMEIIEYNNTRNIKVKFETGSIVKTNYGNFKKRKIKDPLFPIVYEIGYLGIGKFKPSINGKCTIEYQTWHNMLKRCYDSYTINKYQTYQNATVCKEWLNFQNFAEWFHKNYYEIPRGKVELDKDLIKQNNKLYCPKFCSFVPKSINSLLVKKDKSRGKWLIGVCHTKSNKYTARLKNKHLGTFNTELQAFNVYKRAKEKQIKIMINKYRSYLSPRVYLYLRLYRIKITD